MQLIDFQHQAERTLEDAGISTARLDVLVLLEDSLNRDRAQLLAHPEIELTNEQIGVLNEQIRRRSRHIPLAYIRGKTEFYGREFIVNDYVLEPRPESETMIDTLKNLPHIGRSAIIDIGCGSGALGITARLELQDTSAIAIDIDPNCLDLARLNARKLQANIETFQGNLLEPVMDRLPDNYVLLCNLPYVPDNFQINTAATHEPRLAIFGGPDGLDLYRQLFRQLQKLAHKPRYVLTEALPPQHEELTLIADSYGFTLLQSSDFIQVFRPRASTS